MATRECQSQGNGGHLVGLYVLITTRLEFLLAASAKQIHVSQPEQGLAYYYLLTNAMTWSTTMLVRQIIFVACSLVYDTCQTVLCLPSDQ